MKKKLIGIILAVLFTMSLVACSKADDGTTEAFVPTGEFSAENVCLHMVINEDGYYEFLADVTVDFGDDGQILWIEAENNALLAFQVSSYYPGGAYIYSGEKMDELISALESAADAAESTEVKELIQSVLSELEAGGPIEGAST